MLSGEVHNLHFDYASLIWNEFTKHVENKENGKCKFIPHFRFIKLMIQSLMNKYDTISTRLDEDHHTDEFMKHIRVDKTTTKKIGSPIPDGSLVSVDTETNTYKKYVRDRVTMGQSQTG